MLKKVLISLSAAVLLIYGVASAEEAIFKYYPNNPRPSRLIQVYVTANAPYAYVHLTAHRYGKEGIAYHAQYQSVQRIGNTWKWKFHFVNGLPPGSYLMHYYAGKNGDDWQIYLGSTLLPVYSVKGIQVGQPIDDNGSINLTHEVVNQLVDTNADVIRINFRTPGTAPGVLDSAWYSKYDQIVNGLLKSGFVIIGLIGNELKHGANYPWQANAVETGGTNGHNAYIDDLGYKAGQVAQHFNKRIKYWEIWNEPNDLQYFMHPSNFAALLSHVYTQLKYYNHFDCEIISGGVFGHELSGLSYQNSGAQYLQDTYAIGRSRGSWDWCLQHCGTYPLDHIGQHIYISQGSLIDPANLHLYLEYVREAISYYEVVGTDKRTFITEFGWQSPLCVSDSLQAENLTRALNKFSDRFYVATATWFKLQDESNANLYFGLLRENNSFKPSWYRFHDYDPEDSTCAEGFQGWSEYNANSLYHQIGRQEGSNFVATVSQDSPGFLVYGPYDTRFGQGVHDAWFLMMIDNNTANNDKVVTLDVVTEYGEKILATKTIRRKDFNSTYSWQWFRLPFRDPCGGKLEARIYWHDTAYIKFGRLGIDH